MLENATRPKTPIALLASSAAVTVVTKTGLEPMISAEQDEDWYGTEMFGLGTFWKWWSRCVMSAVGGRPEVVSGEADRRN